MSNALASRYTVPSNISALTNVQTLSRTKSRRRKFKDVDLLEPCIVTHVPLGEVFMSLRDKCESIMNIPTERDPVEPADEDPNVNPVEPVEPKPNSTEAEKVDEKQQFCLTSMATKVF